MNIPILDLKAQYAAIQPELDEAILRVAHSQWFILGPEVEALERSMEEYLGVKHALGVSSGTDALLLAMMALGIGPGDEVIVPTFSFFATAGVVSRLNATPVFVDIDPVTYNIDPAAVEAAITENTKAIVPVHLYGQSADLDPIIKLAGERGIAVIEDAAQSIGVRSEDGKRLGTIGTVGCFSFFPSKNLGGYGDAGLVTTNDSDLFHLLKIMRVHGGEQRYYHSVVGGNFRIDAIQAAVLNVKLPHLEGWSAGRRRNADLYNRHFRDLGIAADNPYPDADHPVSLPVAVYQNAGVDDYHIYNQYVIRVRDRDALRERLAEKGIGHEVYYPVPFHQQECFADLGYSTGDFPHAERAAAEVLALPVYPELTTEGIHYIAQTIADFYGEQ